MRVTRGRIYDTAWQRIIGGRRPIQAAFGGRSSGVSPRTCQIHRFSAENPATPVRLKVVTHFFADGITFASGLDNEVLERAKGFEPSTPTLARLCSTPELRPRSGPGRGF
jgi:hypothetical protein